MSQVLVDIQKCRALVRSGLHPEHYRFVVAPTYEGAFRAALMQWGVHPDDTDLYLVNESATIDPGTVLLMDLRIIEANFQAALQSWRLNLS